MRSKILDMSSIMLCVALLLSLLLVPSATAADVGADRMREHGGFLRSLQTAVAAGNETASVLDQCPPCAACEHCASGSDGNSGAAGAATSEPITAQILMLDAQGIVDMVEWNARDYERQTGGRVKIEIKRGPSMPALFEEIENDAKSGGGLFDAYYTNPTILGTAAMLIDQKISTGKLPPPSSNSLARGSSAEGVPKRSSSKRLSSGLLSISSDAEEAAGEGGA